MVINEIFLNDPVLQLQVLFADDDGTSPDQDLVSLWESFQPKVVAVSRKSPSEGSLGLNEFDNPDDEAEKEDEGTEKDEEGTETADGGTR